MLIFSLIVILNIDKFWEKKQIIIRLHHDAMYFRRFIINDLIDIGNRENNE